MTERLVNCSGETMVAAEIRYFLILYEEQNFTRAARRCGVSQPSMTNGIKRLERRFGGKLFHRTRSSQSETRATDLAEALKPHFERISDSARQAQRIAQRLLASGTRAGKKNDMHPHGPTDGSPP
jgi:DNA-binding transcriptional LysR family regulator